MNLGFGLGQAVPEAVNVAWGARLIYPDDLVFNRQDLVGGGDEKAALIKWLNPDGGQGIAKALKAARLFDEKYKLDRAGGEQVVLHQDEVGVIVACPNHSHGYLYVAGWLHNGEADKQASAEFERVVIEPAASFYGSEVDACCEAVRKALKPGMKGKQAAQAVYKALKPLVVAYGQDPKYELSVRGPDAGHYAGNCWLVCWEAGPYEWGIPASFAALEASGKLCEPYYSFDLCFYENE